jgi:hypothetical protein
MNRTFTAVIIISFAGLSARQAAAQSPPPLVYFTPGSCGVLPNPGTDTVKGGCAVAAQAAEDPISGLTGVKVYTTGGPAEASDSSNGTVGLDIFADGGVNGESTLATSASYTGTIPVSWDFTATSSDASNLAWSLQIAFESTGGPVSGQILEGSAGNFTLASGVEMSGTSSLSLSNSVITGYLISLVVAGQPSADSISVSVPQNSLDIAAPAPEPGSLALLSIGVAVFLCSMRRERA